MQQQAKAAIKETTRHMRQSVSEATERAAAEMRKVRKESNNALRLQQQQAEDELKISLA